MPDLKKMLTLEALSAALPSWLKRSTKPEYNADEIDSTLTTNQFVTAYDKDNWNAKGTYSKPSGGIPKSDLSSIVQTSLEKADSALQSETDPTVPSWAKQTNKPSYTQDEVTDGTTYKRVTQTEKNAWSGKQNALSTTQMQAVNSGITSAGVAQISTNQTNILYAINMGVRNICTNAEYHSGDGETSNITYKTLSDGTITLKTPTGKQSGSSDNIFFNVWFKDTDTVLLPTGNYKAKLFGSDIDNIRIEYSYMLNGSSNTIKGNFGEVLEIVMPSGITGSWLRVCAKPNTSFNSSFKIVVCDKTVWDTYTPTEYVPPALPNYDLTRLEAEDRASLAEVVDSGAKNLLDTSLAAIKANGNNVAANISWNNNVGTVPNTGVSFTVNANGTITVNTNGAATARANLYFECHLPATTNNVNYTLSSGGSYSAGAYYIAMFNQSESANPTASPTADFSSKGGSSWMCYLSVLAGTTVNNITFSPMCCTKAAFGVSQKFVPYVPNMYDYQWQAISTYLLARRSGRTITINGYIANISFTANTATLIGNVNTTVGRPHESVRTLCNVGANAYTVGTLGYLIVQQDGNIYVTTTYEGTGVVYVSLSYTI